MNIDGAQLRAIMPRCASPDLWADALNSAMRMYGIDANADRVEMFLAEIALESDELARLSESLSYSADRLMQVWPKRFPAREIANKYANNPHALADYVYANRMGNGDEASGDGWTFRGRGPIQITGKANYQAFADSILEPSVMQCPDKLCTKQYGALSAAWFWKTHGLNELADDNVGDDQDRDFRSITKAINGGAIGLERRQAYLERARKALGG